MKSLFVTNKAYGIKDSSASVVDLDELNLLWGGAMGIFNKDTGLLHPVTIDATAGASSVPALPLSAGTWYDFVVAYSDTNNDDDTNYKPDIVPIKWGNQVKVTKQLYAAPAAKVMALGDTTKPVNFGTIVANSTYTLIIEDRGKSIHDITRKRYYTIVSTGDDTAATLLGKMVAKINADSLQSVTAAVYSTNKGIKFTGAIGKDFGIDVLDSLVGAGWVIESTNSNDTAAFINSIYYSSATTPTLATKYSAATLDSSLGYTPYTPGHGTAEQIKAIEEEFSSHKGDHKSTYRTKAFYNAPSNIVTGDTYTVYTILFKSGVSQSPVQAEGFTNELIIATKGTTLNDDFDVFFGLADSPEVVNATGEG